jgi:1-deoxy-D-xylulose-5-phosphate synthase
VLVHTVCAAGGHLGANLGVVELTIALHRVFRSPHDAIVFDTGHQAYVHKLLTGRQAGFGTLRQAGGLSGYPSRSESAHDWTENSHASTALSYADGIAKAFELTGSLANGRARGRHVVAVIGDGALTGGLAWESLNNLAGADRPVIVVLNDNGRSYAPTVGGLARHLDRLRRTVGGHRPSPGGTLFEHLGLAYVGPVDGHELPALEAALRHAAGLARPVVVHAVTEKGRGYPPAEADDADRMHTIGVLNPATGEPAGPERPSWTSVFGDEIVSIGERRPDLVCLTAAMLRPVGLAGFAERFPGRIFDVGIAEQHAVCSAAGLALGGLHPVVCLYATFLNRAFDQFLMDVALHRLGVTFVLDRAGITGPDGATHHGMWDAGIISTVPGARVAAPRDPARLRELLREAVEVENGPTVVRFPKAVAEPDIDAIARMDGIDILHRGGRLPLDVLVVCVGALAAACLEAARELDEHGIGATVVDPRWVLPTHPTLVHLARRHRLVVTVEDGIRAGGIGAALAQDCADNAVSTPVRTLGLAKDFLPAGDRAEILIRQGLTAANIVDTVLAELPAPRSPEARSTDLLDESGVHRKCGSGDVPGLVRGQPDDGVGHVDGLDPADRHCVQ